jgi:hypothetical protein
VIRIPLIQRESTGRRGLGKRAAVVGVAQLVDDVVPGQPDVDLGYLGAVSIGTPPQEFLLRMFLGRGQAYIEILIPVPEFFGLRIMTVVGAMCQMRCSSIQVLRRQYGR